MENLTDSRKTVETGVNPRLEMEKQPTCSFGGERQSKDQAQARWISRILS